MRRGTREERKPVTRNNNNNNENDGVDKNNDKCKEICIFIKISNRMKT
jgi:hypothetical protein